jgi:hypothetical protein
MNEDKHIRPAVTKASSILGASRSDLIASVVSSKFPWLREGAIVWVRTRDFKHCMFWVKDDLEPVLLNGDDRLAALSRLLVTNVGSLPDSLEADVLAQAIRQLGYDPRGLLASPELLERIGDTLDVWLKNKDASDRQLFISACSGPVLRAEGDHGWELEFNFFNVKGGVEAWKVAGDHAAIHSAESTMLLPDHTFFWPMA